MATTPAKNPTTKPAALRGHAARTRSKSLSAPPAAVSALAAADDAIAAAARAPAPMQSRVATVRNEVQARANDLAREREEYVERQDLLRSQFDAAIAGLQENISDIDNALAVLNDGLAAKQAAE